jgi:hypothetical protein
LGVYVFAGGIDKDDPLSRMQGSRMQ